MRNNPLKLITHFKRLVRDSIESIHSENAHGSRIRRFINLGIRVGMVILLYILLENWLRYIGRLPPESYHQPFIFLELGKRLGENILLLIVPVVLMIVGYKSVWNNWSAFDDVKFVRPFLLLIAGILAWDFSTYDYNLYFNQAHYLDRMLLLVLVALIYWRPVFVFPFLLLLIPVIRQFYYPIGGYTVGEPFLLMRILALFGGTFLLHILTGRRYTKDFIFVALTFIAVAYWRCGLGKIQLNWSTHGHIYHLIFATYANGWLGFLEPTTLVSLARKISPFDWPMRLFTVVVEMGAILFLWRRASLLAFLGGWVLFHLGIFAISGICFWKWMVVDASLFALFLWNTEAKSLQIFTPRHFLLSIFLIIGGIFWANPVNLSWYDTRISYTYRFEAIGESGKRYTLPPRFFAPYDKQFTMSSFGYIVEQPQLGVFWGATKNRGLADALIGAKTPDQIYAIELESGAIGFNQQQSAKFDDFLKRFIANFNIHSSKRTPWSRLQRPPQIWTFSRDNAFKGEERLRQVIVNQITSLYDGKEYLEIRKAVVREIKIPL
jgi:hypothetical protein